MIVCKNCGRKNPNGTEFCQNPDCGEYLGFEGEEVATKTFKSVPAPGPSGAPSTQPGGAPTAPPPPPPVPATPVSPIATTTPLGPGPSRPQAGGPMDPSQAERARRLLAKNPQAAQPRARPPAEADNRPQATPVVQSEMPDLKPGEIACPTCGRGNGPERHFCRQCGTELKAPAPPPVPVPTGPLPPPPPETMVLPVKPKKPKDSRPFFKRPAPLIITLILILVVFLTAIALLGRSLASSIGGDGGTPVTAAPGGGGSDSGGGSSDGYKAEVAGTSGNDSEATRALDGDTSTYWQGAAASDDSPDRIGVSFGQTVNLARVVIYPGAAGDEFNDQPRPHRGYLEFPDGSRVEFELQDSSDAQEISFPAVEVDGVSVNITEAYNGGQSDPVPITELQFFGP